MGAQNHIMSLSLFPTVRLQVMNSVLDVEQPLVQDQLRDIDAQLQKAEESLNWNSEGQGTQKYEIFAHIYQLALVLCFLKCRCASPKNTKQTDKQKKPSTAMFLFPGSMTLLPKKILRLCCECWRKCFLSVPHTEGNSTHSCLHVVYI